MAYATINPATGEQLPTFPEHTAVEVEAALATAQKAFGNWRRLSYPPRTDDASVRANFIEQKHEIREFPENPDNESAYFDAFFKHLRMASSLHY